jgi:hypothetical protein
VRARAQLVKVDAMLGYQEKAAAAAGAHAPAPAPPPKKKRFLFF